MPSDLWKKILPAGLAVLAVVLLYSAPRPGTASAAVSGGGSLTIIDPEGKAAGFCPLKHTDVKASISGFIARVDVAQEFENPAKEKIEAVYTFPLPPGAAVDSMTITAGDRVIKGKIKRREEARQIYEAAKRQGRLAGLLDQERPNIFTQAVANIAPGAKVKVNISYVDTLEYEAGTYNFNFPMVVAPRYIPGKTATGRSGGGWAPDTDRIPDASRITPPVTPEGTRAGHDISVEVSLDAGVPISSLECPTHDVNIERRGPRQAVVHLKDKAVIPNKDFILKYDAAGKRVEDAVLTHHDTRGGFFTLILQPPERVTAPETTPKEIVFVLDTSGSMSGFPIEKAKEAMRLALDGLNPNDTFNLITFSGDTAILFPKPVRATEEKMRKAQEFLQSRYGSGGTEMMKAIRAALAPSGEEGHVRVVCFMTDGAVGNDMEIISEVQKHPEARVFAFGIGSAVNHFLLDNMAKYGRGEVEYVGLNDDGSKAARRFHERVRSPLLTDISIDWGGLAVTDVYPQRVPDLFAARPLVITGRYGKAGSDAIRLRGKMPGRDFAREIRVNLPASEAGHDVLATLWARRRIEDLMAGDFAGLHRGAMRKDLQEQITQVGLDYRLMTQFTSFVAVEETTVTDKGGVPRRVEVPVEMPEGMSYEGVFGTRGEAVFAPAAMQFGTFDTGVVGGIIGRPRLSMQKTLPGNMPPPPPPPQSAGVRDSSLKLHSALRTLISNPSMASQARFVQNGKALIQVYLADTSPATLAKLRTLGFEVVRQPGTGTIVTGRIPVGQLAALAALEAVRYVAPVV